MLKKKRKYLKEGAPRPPCWSFSDIRKIAFECDQNHSSVLVTVFQNVFLKNEDNINGI
jgi:hypothetical protein